MTFLLSFGLGARWKHSSVLTRTRRRLPSWELPIFLALSKGQATTFFIFQVVRCSFSMLLSCNISSCFLSNPLLISEESIFLCVCVCVCVFVCMHCMCVWTYMLSWVGILGHSVNTWHPRPSLSQWNEKKFYALVQLPECQWTIEHSRYFGSFLYVTFVCVGVTLVWQYDALPSIASHAWFLTKWFHKQFP